VTADLDDVLQQLQAVEERLRELAYDRLRVAAEDGDADAAAEEKKILTARRAIERAINALGGAPRDFD
jgi:DNA-binding FrmR family transcriptional regulator